MAAIAVIVLGLSCGSDPATSAQNDPTVELEPNVGGISENNPAATGTNVGGSSGEGERAGGDDVVPNQLQVDAGEALFPSGLDNAFRLSKAQKVYDTDSLNPEVASVAQRGSTVLKVVDIENAELPIAEGLIAPTVVVSALEPSEATTIIDGLRNRESVTLANTVGTMGFWGDGSTGDDTTANSTLALVVPERGIVLYSLWDRPENALLGLDVLSAEGLVAVADSLTVVSDYDFVALQRRVVASQLAAVKTSLHNQDGLSVAYDSSNSDQYVALVAPLGGQPDRIQFAWPENGEVLVADIPLVRAPDRAVVGRIDHPNNVALGLVAGIAPQGTTIVELSTDVQAMRVVPAETSDREFPTFYAAVLNGAGELRTGPYSVLTYADTELVSTGSY